MDFLRREGRAGAQKTGSTVDERVIHPPGHTALRRRIAGGVLGSPQAVGGRLGVSRRPVAARADCPFGGRCKLVVSSAPVRQLAPRTQPARAPNQPGTSRTQPARSPASPSACVRVPAPRAPAGFGSPRPTPPAPPPPRPPPRRTAAGGPPSPSPPGAMMVHRRLRHHPRRSTFTAATLATASPLPPFMHTQPSYTLAAVLSPRGRRLRL